MPVKFRDTIKINDSYTLPSVDGSSGQAITTDGSGALSFSTISGSNTTYTVNSVTSGDNAIIRLTGSDSSTDDVTIAAGSNISISETGDTITIASTATGSVTEAFKTIAISGQSSVVAESATDTLNLVAGNNITLSTNASTDTITVASSAGSSTLNVEKNILTGNGSATAFTVSSTIASENNTQIYIDGVYQSKDNYSTSGTTVTFSTAPPNGAEIEVIHFVSVQGAIKVDSFTGNNSLVAFTTGASIIDEDNTQIYIDGVYQSKDNYTTSGNVITFSTAPGTGAIIEVVHIKAIDLSTIVGDQLTGNGSATAFTLSRSIDDENNTFVFINGVYQDKSTYSISGTTLTFNTAPQSGYTIEVMSFNSISIAKTGVTSFNGSTGAVSSDYNVSVINSATTAVKNTLYVFTGSAALTLPAGVVGNSIKISNRSATSTCTVLPNGTNKIMGSNTTMTLDDENASFELIYSGTAQGWIIIGQ